MKKILTLIALIVVNECKSQSIDVMANMSFANPKDELAKNYGHLNASCYMARLNIFQLKYSANTALKFGIVGAIENMGFTDESYSLTTNNLTASLTSYGLVVQPFALKNFRGLAQITNDKNNEDGQSDGYYKGEGFGGSGALLLLYKIVVSPLSFEMGKSNLILTQVGFTDVKRNPTYFGWSWNPNFNFSHRFRMGLYFGSRTYKWTNSSSTSSGIGTFYIGVNAGLNLSNK